MDIKKLIKVATEYLPLLLFFIFFKKYGILVATQVVVISSIIMIVINYAVNKKIPPITLISVGLLAFFGGLTIIFDDPRFIKIKPTIVNGVFALVLFAGAHMKKPFLKKLMGEKIRFKNDQTWHDLAIRFALFFSALAVANEVIWRNFSDNTWVWYKTFGIMILNVIFIATQIKFINRNIVQK
ncbi:MAG: septation protein IspZ [Rickettsiales bacterium]